MQNLTLKIFEYETRKTANVNVNAIKNSAEVYRIIGDSYLDALTGK
jgi:hypothetical protein